MSGSVASRKPERDFRRASRTRKPDRRKRTPPVSIRLSDDERHLLAAHAGDKPLSTYVRDYVLRGHKAKRRPRRKQATADQKELALLLALLGRSEISPLLREVLSCAETRKLLLDEEIKAELRQACADIATIRTTLILALGLRSGAVS